MRNFKQSLINREDTISGVIISNILEKADPDGLIHAVAVAEISAIIADGSSGIDYWKPELWLASLLPDVGKLGIPSGNLTGRCWLSTDKLRDGE